MKKSFFFGLMVAIVGCLVFGNFSGAMAADESPAEFYKKNVVTMIIGFNPGGGADYAGRLLSSYWSEATGGAMVVKNMPGAGGLVATNYVSAAKPDGLTIGFGMFGNAYLSPYITKDPAAKFDYKKLNWLIGAFHEPFGLHVSAKRPYETIDDLKKAKGLKIAALTPFGPDSIAEIAMIDFLGLDAKIVTGYKGGSAMALAAGKGEVDIVPLPTGTGLDSMNKGFVKAPIVVMAPERVSAFKDSLAFPEVLQMTPEQKAFYKAADTASYTLRIGAAAEGVPADRVKFMRDAFAKVVTMDGFKQQAALSFPLGPTPLIGADLDAFVAEAGDIQIKPIEALIKKYLAIQ